MRKRKGGNLQISSTMVFFPLYFIMDSGYTNEVSVYKLYLLGVNLSVIGRVLGQAFLRTTSPSRLRRATSPGRGGFGSPRKVNGFARGSPTRGAVERSETERLYEGEPFLCRKVRLMASPVSFWRNVWYNGFAVHPAYLTGEEVDALAYFLTFLVSVGADVVSHFICKWLDRCEENRKA